MFEDTHQKLLSLYHWIEEYQKENHCSPSYREIADLFNTSTSVASYYLDELEKIGWLARGRAHTARSFYLLPLPESEKQNAV